MFSPQKFLHIGRMDPAGFEPASATVTECRVSITPRALCAVSVICAGIARLSVTIFVDLFQSGNARQLRNSIGVQWHTINLLSMAECNALKKRADSFSRPMGDSMKTQFERMMDGLNDVEAFLAGEQEGFKAHVPQDVDVKAIRNRLGMTQAKFSDTFGFSLDAIKHWEGGRRIPEASARTLLTVIDRNPAAVLTALKPAAFAAAVGSSKSSTAHSRSEKKRRASRDTRRKAYSAGVK